jgi:D-glucosaminate-6-phosphate ammonia-lyase
VTTGAASALLLAVASCVTGLDIIKMERLPDTSTMRNEIVIARHHRNAYDHMIRAVGVKLVEAGLQEHSEENVGRCVDAALQALRQMA